MVNSTSQYGNLSIAHDAKDISMVETVNQSKILN
jgi:hypothetical protein